MPDWEKITLWVQAAKLGDELAFAELVRAYQDIAVAYATSILGDYHLGEDAAQEAFVEAHRELPNLREPAAFAAWFRRIAMARDRGYTEMEKLLEAALAGPREATPRDAGIADSIRAGDLTLVRNLLDAVCHSRMPKMKARLWRSVTPNF
ncbi:MAG: sigma factor [Acidobacteriota bacterium]